MLNTIWSIVEKVFDYLFMQNAPFTVILVGMGLIVWRMWKSQKKTMSALKEWKIDMDVLNRQKARVGYHFSEVSQILKKNFNELRGKELLRNGIPEDRLGVEIISDSEVHRYEVQVELLFDRYIKPQVEIFYIENHLHEKSEREFEGGYMDACVNSMVTEFSQRFNQWWWPGTIPDRDTTKDEQLKLMPEITDAIKRMFREAREISVDYRSRHAA